MRRVADGRVVLLGLRSAWGRYIYIYIYGGFLFEVYLRSSMGYIDIYIWLIQIQGIIKMLKSMKAFMGSIHDLGF